jgi:hypothetical protein
MTRSSPPQWATTGWPREEIAPNEKGLLEVEMAGTGILRIRRNAIEKMIAQSSPYKSRSKVGLAYPLFMFELTDTGLRGEDVMFCRKWRALGGKVFIDPTIETGHLTALYNTGRLSDFLAAQPAIITCMDELSGQVEQIGNAYSQTADANRSGSRA